MHNNLEYPLVSVVLPAYNAQEYILEAVESILEQTFSDFELIIINDGSVDETFNILETIKAKDPRVRVYHRENQGLVKSLNFAINESRGKYIARMDADDISLPTRLEKQVDVLELNRNIDVVGCDYFTIDSRGYRKKLVELPKSSSDILLALTYSVPVAHPSVMIRKEIFERYLYQESYVEDYLLWANIFAVDNFYNLEEPLFEYRHNYGSSFSDTKRLRMMKEEASVSKNYIEKNFIRDLCGYS
jgi:glycosyltransferase involved in cell wall biosynthesis